MRTERPPLQHYSPPPHPWSGMPDRSFYSGEGYVPSDVEDRVYSLIQRILFFCCGEIED